MSDATDPKSTLQLGRPTAAITRTDAPPAAAGGGGEERFKFKLSLPGTNLGGNWLCKNDGDALAYQSYAVPGDPNPDNLPSMREFQWVESGNGEGLLQDQYGLFLSYEVNWWLVYFSYHAASVAWKFEGNRLVRASDGAVLTYYYNEHWPLADRKIWLSVAPMSESAITVEKVDV